MGSKVMRLRLLQTWAVLFKCGQLPIEVGTFFLTRPSGAVMKKDGFSVSSWTLQRLGLGHGQQGSEAKTATDLGRSI